jgi:hypothetical protein
MVLTPWTVRNAVQLNSFVPVSTNTGDNLCMGFNPDATGGFMAARNCDTGEFYVDGPAAEVRRDARNRAYAIRWALSNPGRLPALSLKKLEFTFANDTDGLRALESFGSDPFLGDRGRRVVGVGMNAYFFGVFALALVGSVLLARGAWRDRSRDSAGLMLLVVTVAGLVPPVISFGEPRFKVPLAPCFALLAAVAIEALWGRWFGPADRAASQAR